MAHQLTTSSGNLCVWMKPPWLMPCIAWAMAELHQPNYNLPTTSWVTRSARVVFSFAKAWLLRDIRVKVRPVSQLPVPALWTHILKLRRLSRNQNYSWCCWPGFSATFITLGFWRNDQRWICTNCNEGQKHINEEEEEYLDELEDALMSRLVPLIRTFTIRYSYDIVKSLRPQM